MSVRHHLLFVATLAACTAPAAEDTLTQASSGARCGWTQWGHDASHDGAGCAAGQTLAAQRARVVLDPFVDQAVAEFGFGDDGPLLTHFQVPLIDGDDVFVMRKAGTYPSCDPPGSGTPFPCGPDAIDRLVWTERAYRWRHGQLEERWSFASDWKPPAVGIEEMFQPALAGRYLYVPGAGGSVFKVDAHDGRLVTRIAPFGTSLDPHTYVWGGIAAGPGGSIYYNAVAYDPAAGGDVLGAWLVKVDDRDRVSRVDYTTLIPGAPAPTALCFKTFSTSVPRPARPFPPPPLPDGSPALPDRAPCGSQAPGLNLTPAIGRDGTIFTASRADFAIGYSYIVALNPDLSLKWATSLRGLVNDGCGVHRPGFPEGDVRCSTTFSAVGVDPTTNMPPALDVDDVSSSTPVALPDGGVVYGALDNYNFSRGHLVKLDRDGRFTGSFSFGWDSTPAIYEHDGTYSIVVKDNHYDSEGPFYVTQLSKDLQIEWRFQNTTTQACVRQPDGTLQCSDTTADGAAHPNGFEWCVNAPAVDARGNVYVNAEDGYVYQIGQGGLLKTQTFLNQALGAAYTPISLDPGGRVYALNNGELTVLGR
jgi:hypothetical protein